MWQKRLLENKGVTLLELTLAVALFAMVLGATAQSLVSYYVALDMQNQKNTAMQHCIGVLSNMRNTRDANPANFPAAVTAAWPNNATVAGIGTLKKEVIRVNYTNVAANPLQVSVTSSWVDIKNRPMTINATTLLTDR